MRKKIFVKWWPCSDYQRKMKKRHGVWVAHSKVAGQIKISPLKGKEAILIGNIQILQVTLGA